MRLFFLLFLFFVYSQAKIIQTDQLFNKKIVHVKQKEFAYAKTFYAKTMINEAKIIDIAPRFSGFVENLTADKNYAFVDANTPLLSVYSDEILSAINELKLAQKLGKQSGLYQSAYNKLLRFDLHKKTLAKITQGAFKDSDIQIYSPISGYIIQKKINQKSAFKKGQLLFQIADFQNLWVIAKVYQQDVGFLSKAMAAKIMIDGISEPIIASVDYIYPSVSEKDQTIDVRLVIDNKENLILPNMFATVELSKKARKILSLPRSAVLSKGEKHFVFKPLNEKEYEPVIIKAERIDSESYEILEGLQEGDAVIDRVMFMQDSDAITNGLYESDEEW
ncbi:MAG: efflux RND transporter periplasmic adaptor subunit [Sulfurospirillum sp.]|nr:efflux RND transporter periplasmic adaptor subunit [Sulfurospirillum sp.]